MKPQMAYNSSTRPLKRNFLLGIVNDSPPLPTILGALGNVTE